MFIFLSIEWNIKSGKKKLDSSFKSKVVQILQSFDMLKR